MLHICFVFRLTFQVITPSASSLLIHLSLFPYLINLLPCPQMKPWGRSEYWGLGAEYDPDWVLTEAQKQLRAELIELCRTKIRPRAVSFFFLSLSLFLFICVYVRVHTRTYIHAYIQIIITVIMIIAVVVVVAVMIRDK